MRERTTVLGAALFWILIGLLASGCVHTGPKPPAQPTPIVSPTPPPVTGGPSCGEFGGPQAQCGDHWLTPAPAGLVDLGQTHDCQPCYGPPTPAEPPDVVAQLEPQYVCWGCDGDAFEVVGGGFLANRITSMLGLTGTMQGDLEHRRNTEEPDDIVLARIPQWAAAAVKNKRGIWLGLNWIGLLFNADGTVKDAALVRRTIKAFAPYWSAVRMIWLVGEAGMTAAQIDAVAAYVESIELELGLELRPLSVDVLEKELNEQEPQLAKNKRLIWVPEAYDAGFGSGSRAEDCRLIQSALSRQYALLPPTSYYGLWYPTYNRNGPQREYNTETGWAQSKEDLAALPKCVENWVQADPERKRRIKIRAFFCIYRRKNADSSGYAGGGASDYGRLLYDQIARVVAIGKGQPDPGPEVPATPPREEPTPESPLPPNTPCGMYWAQQSCGASGSDHDCDLTLICKGGALHPVAEVDYQVEQPLCGDGSIEGSSGTLTFSAGVTSRQVRVPFPPEATEHAERMVRVVAVRGAALYAGEDHARGNWSPTTRGFSQLRGQCGYLTSPGNPVGSIVISGADLQARAKSEEEIFLVSYHLEDTSGKVVAKNRVGKSRTNMSVIPLEVLVPAGAQGQVGWIVVDSVVTRDSKTPQPWIGPRRAPYYSTAK